MVLERNLCNVVCQTEEDAVNVRVWSGVLADFIHQISAKYLERRKVDVGGLLEENFGQFSVKAAA